MTLITFPWLVDNVATNATSVVFSDPDEDYGLRRTDTEEVIIAAGTALTNVATGQYEYELDDEVEGLPYEYWIRVVYDGETYHVQNFISSGDEPLQKTLKFVVIAAGSAVELDDPPTLSNPTGSYGAVRLDTNAIVVDDGEEFDLVGSLYMVSFNEPAEDLTYRYYVEAVYQEVTYHLARTTAYMQSAALVFGRYTNSHLIEQQYGVENVHKWLGIDDSDEAVDWALRMYGFIDRVESSIDDTLRGGPFTVPFTAPAPKTVVDIATLLAGVAMYESRGVVDMNAETGQPQHRLHYQKKQAEKDLAKIRAGQMRLDLDETIRHPVVAECE